LGPSHGLDDANGDQFKNELDYVTLASMTEGYTVSDMKDLVGGALQQAVIRCTQSKEEVSAWVLKSSVRRLIVQVAFSLDDFTAAQAAFTPLSLRGVSLQKSDINWSDIGGELGTCTTIC